MSGPSDSSRGSAALAGWPGLAACGATGLPNVVPPDFTLPGEPGWIGDTRAPLRLVSPVPGPGAGAPGAAGSLAAPEADAGAGAAGSAGAGLPDGPVSPAASAA